jgi:hypothetical protein
MLSVVLYGCETWSFAQRVNENIVLRKIYGPMNDEVTKKIDTIT